METCNWQNMNHTAETIFCLHKFNETKIKIKETVGSQVSSMFSFLCISFFPKFKAKSDMDTGNNIVGTSDQDQENSAVEMKVIEPAFDKTKDLEEKLKRYISQGAIPKSFRSSMLDFAESNNSVVKLSPDPQIEELQLDTLAECVPTSLKSIRGYAREDDDYTEEGL